MSPRRARRAGPASGLAARHGPAPCPQGPARREGPARHEGPARRACRGSRVLVPATASWPRPPRSVASAFLTPSLHAVPAFASPWGFGVGRGPRGSGPWGTHSSAPQEAAPVPSLPSEDPGMGAPRPRGPGQRHGDREADVREQEVTVPEPAGDARPPVASDSAQAAGSGRRPPQRPGTPLRSPTATPPPQEAPSFTRSGVQAGCAPLARSRVLCKPRV